MRERSNKNNSKDVQCWRIQLDEVYQQQQPREGIPENHRREGVKDTDLVNEELPTERALGVHWNVEKDQLCFKLSLKTENIARRGTLSTLSSFYDTLGLASPFILRGKKILQDLCQEGLKWNETISEMYQRKWECWKKDLIGLEKVEFKRCIKSGGFGKIVHISLHSFSDASELGYGESCYEYGLVDEYGHIHCT